MSLSPTIRIWLLALAGPLIGFAHLMAVYGLASLEEGPAGANVLAIRLTMAATTTVSSLANLGLIWLAWRGRLPQLAREPDEQASRFWGGVIGFGAAISLVTVLLQGVPILVVR